MKLGRRVSAGLCALALMAALVAYPLRARAMSAVLPAAGLALTVTAFLNLAGIYPFAADNQTFTGWTEDLQTLINQYNDDGGNITPQEIRAFIFGGSVLLTHNAYVALRGFVQWIVDTFSLTDNQTGVDVGVTASVLNASLLSALELATASGYDYSSWYDIISSYDFPLQYGGYDLSRVRLWVYCDVGSRYVGQSPFSIFLFYSGYSYARAFYSWGDGDGHSMRLAEAFPYRVADSSMHWPDLEELHFTGTEVDFCFDYAGSSSILSGITVDTSTVSIPAELPEDMPENKMIGLSVAASTVVNPDTGATTSVPATVMTPEKVQEIIQQGVMERERPVVRSVEVEVAEDVTLDTETGELAVAEPGTVLITETDIPLSLGDYAIPSLSTVFPFSIPWDIMRIWQALDAEPRFPLQDFSMTLNVPLLFGDAPPTVRFGLDAFPEDVAAKMDDVALVVRYSLLLVACIGFLIFISQFIKF